MSKGKGPPPAAENKCGSESLMNSKPHTDSSKWCGWRTEHMGTYEKKNDMNGVAHKGSSKQRCALELSIAGCKHTTGHRRKPYYVQPWYIKAFHAAAFKGDTAVVYSISQTYSCRFYVLFTYRTKVHRIQQSTLRTQAYA